MSEVTIKTVTSKKDLMKFIKLPWKLYQDDPNWVPPLIMDRKKLLDKKHNPFFRHAEMDLFLASRHGELVGRIGGICNEKHNQFHKDKMGFFGFFESINDSEVAKVLFDTVISWLKGRGKDGMYGPMNPSTNDEVGLLIKGFETPPFIMMPHNLPYYQGLYESYGLKKSKDLYAWYIDAVKQEVPERMVRIARETTSRNKITLRNLKKKNLKQELRLIREIFNDAWSNNWGFIPLTDEELEHAANDLKQIADEQFLLLAEKEGKPIGFSITLPNINEILIKNRNGRLFPTGLIRMLTGLKKIKTLRLPLLGIIKEYQHIGLGSIFYMESLNRAKKIGVKAGELSWILEDNIPMNKAIQNLGAEIYKTYRVYEHSF
jgi:GNAT superfamily N-acetyltransferase